MRHFLIPEAGATIGARSDCELVLDSGFVSRAHARIFSEDGSYFIIDTRSRNGVLINGVRLRPDRPHRLTSGDAIEIRPFVLTFYLRSGGTLPLPTQPDEAEELYVDVDAQEVFIRGMRLPVHLAKREFDLLALLYENRGKVVRKKEAGEAVWGRDSFDDNMLHNLVHHLKRKFTDAGADMSRYLIVKPGAGYRLDCQPVEPSNQRNQ